MILLYPLCHPELVEGSVQKVAVDLRARDGLRLVARASRLANAGVNLLVILPERGERLIAPVERLVIAIILAIECALGKRRDVHPLRAQMAAGKRNGRDRFFGRCLHELSARSVRRIRVWARGIL